MKISVHAPLNPTGVGIHAQRLLHELTYFKMSREIDLDIIPVGPVSYSTSPAVRANLSDHLMRQQMKRTHDAIIVMDLPRKCNEWLYTNLHYIPSSTLKLAYTVFEVYPKETGVEALDYRGELQSLGHFDGVIVPSTHCAEILLNLGLKNVYIVPEGHSVQDTKLWDAQNSEFEFCSVGKFELRKGIPDVMDVLAELGKEGLQCRVNAWWDNRYAPNMLKDNLAGRGFVRSSCHPDAWTAGSVSILLCHHLQWQDDLIDRMRTSDAFLLPSRAEGWGLPTCDAIALGMPTVTTCNTGHADYVSPYAEQFPEYIVQSGEPYLAHDGMFFRQNGYWHSVDRQDLKRKILSIVEETPDEKRLSQFAQEMRNNFSWESSSKKLVKLLQSLS